MWIASCFNSLMKSAKAYKIRLRLELGVLKKEARLANNSDALFSNQATEGAQPPVDSCEKDFKSQVKIEVTDRRKRKRKQAKSMGVALPQRCSFSVEDHTVKCVVNEDTGIGEIKTRSKTKNEATESCTPAALTKSPCTPAASTKLHRARARTLLEKAKAKDCVRKSTTVSKKTPKSKKEKGWSLSPQSQSFKRSRSGRLLMPTLEYWRNQRAIYSADRTITEIEEGIHPDTPDPVTTNEAAPSPCNGEEGRRQEKHN